jgi:hypothetical protein
MSGRAKPPRAPRKVEALIDSIRTHVKIDDGSYLVRMTEAEFALWNAAKGQADHWAKRKAETGVGFEEFMALVSVEEDKNRALRAKQAMKVEAGVRLAEKHHAPTRDAMALVHAWWREHGEGKMTKDAAADAIVAKKLVIEKRSTIVRWLYPKFLKLTAKV